MSEKSELEVLREQMEALKAENESLTRQRAEPNVTFKVGAKGGVSIYGLGRLPTTLYGDQWKLILDHADELRSFIRDNARLLKSKE